MEAVGLKRDRERIVAAILSRAIGGWLLGGDKCCNRCSDRRIVRSVQAITSLDATAEVGDRHDMC